MKKSRNRSEKIEFYVLPEEKEIIKKKMEIARQKNMSDYLRQAAVYEKVVVYNYDALSLREMTSEINKIGVNINQVAARVNSTDNIYGEDVEYLKEQVQKIWQIQKPILSKLH